MIGQDDAVHPSENKRRKDSPIIYPPLHLLVLKFLSNTLSSPFLAFSCLSCLCTPPHFILYFFFYVDDVWRIIDIVIEKTE